MGGEMEPTMLKSSSMSMSGMSVGEPADCGDPSVDTSDIPPSAEARYVDERGNGSEFMRTGSGRRKVPG